MSLYAPPQWVQNLEYDANADRYLIESVWPTAGVLSGLQVGPRAEGANRSVDVAGGRCVVAGADAPDQGSYLCRLKGKVNLPLGAAPGAGQSRIDMIVAQVIDDVAAGEGTPGWAVTVVPGTEAGTPSPPTLPLTSLPLAAVTVAFGTETIGPALIRDRRLFVPDLTPSPWIDWTPEWLANNAPGPWLGSGGYIAASYCMLTAHAVAIHFDLTTGVNWNGGLGFWSWTLPPGMIAEGYHYGAARVYPNPTFLPYLGIMRLDHDADQFYIESLIAFDTNHIGAIGAQPSMPPDWNGALTGSARGSLVFDLR